MRRITPIAATLLLAAAISQAGETAIKIQTADSSPADLKMVGPATADVGKPITIVVTGLPEVDLDKTIGDQVKWVELLRFDVSCPDNAKPAELEKELVMSVSPWQWKLRLTLTCPVVGAYVVVCDWNEPPFGLALHRVTVGGVPPVPPPIPPPDPSAATAFVLYEAQQMTPTENLLLLDLRDDPDLSPKLQILDQNALGERASQIPRVQAAVKAASGKQLPLLILFDAAGSVSAVADLPDTLDGIRAKLKEAGL
jgi:hypothetical protein